MIARDRKFRFSVFQHAKDNYAGLRALTFAEIQAFLAKRIVSADKRRTMAFSPAIYEPGQNLLRVTNDDGAETTETVQAVDGEIQRINENVRGLSFAVFDLDHMEPADFDRIIGNIRASGLAHACYSTFSHTAQEPKARLCLFPDRDIRPDEWPDVWATIAETFQLPADTSCRNLGRIFFAPSSPPGAKDAFAFSADGEVFPVEDAVTVQRKAREAQRPQPARPATAAMARFKDALERFNAAHPPTWTRKGGQCPVDGCEGKNSFKALPGDETRWVCFHSSHPDACGFIGESCHTGDALDLVAYAAHRGRKEHLVAEGYLAKWEPRPEPPALGDDDAPPELRGLEAHEQQRLPAAGCPEGWTQAKAADGKPAGLPEAPKSQPDPLLQRAIADLRGRRQTTGERAIRFESAAELLSRKVKKPLWLVRGLLPERGVAVIAGEPKSNKTWAAIELGMSVATATPAFGEFDSSHRRSVALFLAEDDEQAVQNRLRSLGATEKRADGRLKNLHISYRRALNLLDEREVAGLVAACRALPEPPAMVVLDPLRDLHGADENDSTEMARVMGQLRALRDVLGCTVLFVHHVSKSTKDTADRRPGQRMRGSSAIHGAVDAGIYLSGTRAEDNHRWTNRVDVEIKGGKGAGHFDLQLEVGDDPETDQAVRAEWKVIRGDEDGRDATKAEVAAVLAKAKEPMSTEAIRTAVGKGKTAVQGALFDLERKGLAGKSYQGRKVTGWVVKTPPSSDPDRSGPMRTQSGSKGCSLDPDRSGPPPVGGGSGSGSASHHWSEVDQTADLDPPKSPDPDNVVHLSLHGGVQA